MNLHTLLQSTTIPQLFMMSCDTNQLINVETKQIFESLFNSPMKNRSVKIILNIQSENDTVTLLQDIAKEALGNGFVTGDKELIWCDLTSSSQEELLEIAVNFDGSEIALY